MNEFSEQFTGDMPSADMMYHAFMQDEWSTVRDKWPDKYRIK